MESNYLVEEVKDTRGFFRYCKIYVGDSEFILDKKGIIFLKESFDNGNLIVDESYLARLNNGKIEYFHREFKKLSEGVGIGCIVHHKNFKREDNRNCNLQIMSGEEHKLLHEEKTQAKFMKIQERYAKKGERIRKKYEERGERMRERYRKRGERMRARYSR